MARRITSVAIHCSATRPSMDVGAKDITAWHKKKGWRTIGYHWVIRRDGTLEKGRDEAIAGAHVEGHNANSIGVCLVGGVSEKDFTKAESNYTPRQWATLKRLCADLARRYPAAVFKGHCDYPKVHKACPSFDARAWAKEQGLRT